MEALDARDPRRIGAYRLIGRLGAGGMGEVFLARSERGRTVAVKLVRTELAEHDEFRRRFRHEVQAARRVGGQWTAPVLDADTEAAVPWVATGYVAGPSLHAVVSADHGPLPERSVRILAAGLGHALQDIHAAGMVHRDLKPSNVLITIDGPRVIDFGIARALETATDVDLTRTGALVGSPGFMAPEQVRGDRVTPACDVFCLGSVLAYAATGQLPFGSAHSGVHALMFRIAQEAPDLARVPESLRDLVADCLRKEPAARPALAEVLQRVGAGDTVHDGRALEPWLPAPLVARLGRHAVGLLDVEDPDHPEHRGGTVALRKAGAVVPAEAGPGAAPAGAATPGATGEDPPAPGAGASVAAPQQAAPGAGPPGSAPQQAAGPAPAAPRPSPAEASGPSRPLPPAAPDLHHAPTMAATTPPPGLAKTPPHPPTPAPYGHPQGPPAAAYGYPQQPPPGGPYGYPQPAAYGYPPAQPLPPQAPYGSAATPPYGPPPLPAPGGRDEGRGRGAATAVLVALALLVALGAGLGVWVLMRGGDGSSVATGPGGSASTAPGDTQDDAPGETYPDDDQGADEPTDGGDEPDPAALPADFVGTWSGGSDGQSWDLTLTEGSEGDTVMSLTGSGPTFRCTWEAALDTGGPSPVLAASELLTSDGSCRPGARSRLELLPDGSLQRTQLGTGKPPVIYTRTSG
ncbi:serine/threonine-protein kinase [Streptomyces sp. NPDC060194]|uniref:serine/threonine-protein kinase n=1 Tax=Streptomyces sp. NPDC060194 TaxID=3347069 RepID=UPI003666A8FF